MTDEPDPVFAPVELAARPKAEERDPWLARRGLGFGCSDIAALFLALGKRDWLGAPGYLRAHASALFAEKAGLRKRRKPGRAAQIGVLRERAVLDAWRLRLPDAVEFGSVQHSDAVPREWLPLVDRHEPRLVGTPDAWARLVCGCLLSVQIKCSASFHASLPWHWHVQCQAEMAVTGAPFAVLVCGQEWAAWHGDDGPLSAWLIERDEAEINHIRACVREGWARVEQLRAA